LAAVNLEKSQTGKDVKTNAQSVALAESLLGELKGTTAMGRLVIDLKKILSVGTDEKEEESQQVVLKDGDKLYIPAKTQEVTIIGEVQQTTSHLYSDYKSRDDYIAMSGGLTHKADDNRIYIVRANGAVISDESTGWFGDSDEVRPGDTIVVPLDAERMKPLTFWTSIVQIVYQLGIAAAAWNTVGVF
jgi:polysaccharide export outer membrane protein